MNYYRIKGQYGIYLLTKKEINKALDRENFGVLEKILKEKDYEKTTTKKTSRKKHNTSKNTN